MNSGVGILASAFSFLFFSAVHLYAQAAPAAVTQTNAPPSTASAAEIARALPRIPISQAGGVTSPFVRTHGIVTAVGSEDFWLSDSEGGLNVYCGFPPAVTIGQSLELLGAPKTERQERRLSLLSILSSAPGRVPTPVHLAARQLYESARHGQRVTARGNFLHSIPTDYGDILILQEGDTSFEARRRFPAGSSVHPLAAGSRLSVTGILRARGGDGPENAPRIIVVDPDDIQVLSRGPLSIGATIAIVGGLSLALSAGLVALGIAHRRLKDFNVRLEAQDRELVLLNSELEKRIKARTGELEAANAKLQREIGEREAMQKKVADNERRYRLLVEQVEAIVWEFDPQTECMCYVSPQAARLGYPLEQWLTKGFWNECLHPEDREFAIAYCAAETSKGLNHELQYRFLKADGGFIWFDDKVAVETKADGSRFLRGILIDITARKEWERALRETEELFSTAFHSSPAISAITSFPDGVFIDVNQRLLDATGYRRDEVIGRTATELGLWADPELRKKITEQMALGTPAHQVEYDIVDKFGCRHTLLGSLQRVALGGRQCILSINQDITDRKRAEVSLRDSEQRFARAFHASPAIVVITRESDGRYIDVNERFTQLMGYTRDEVLGHTAMELGIWVHPEERKTILEPILHGQSVRNVECQFRAKSGALHTVLLSVEKIMLGGEPCLLGINNDITDLKKAEALRTAQNQVLEMIAQGARLDETLARLVLGVEAQAEGLLCSIFLLSRDGKHLRLSAAPSLPEEYNRKVDGIEIGPEAGSCGTAAHFGEPVVVEDILTDSKWNGIRDWLLPHGLRACWSTPIFDAQHRILGTFAMYYRRPGRPSEEHRRLLQTATHTAAICIRRARDEESIQESQRALQQQNDLLNEMEQLAEIGAWSLDLHDGCLVWSDQVFRIHELPSDFTPVVESAIAFYAPEARPMIAAAVREASETGRPWDLELPFVTARGNRRWVRAQGTAEIVNGRAIRLHGAFQDITRRKQAEEALRLSEERFAKAFDLSPAITVISRRSDGRYLDVNARFTETLGYSREEAIGQTSLSLNLWVHPEKRSEILRQVEAHGCARDVECEYVDKAGRVHVMLTSIEPITIAGEPCLLSLNHDISARRRVENGLRVLVSCINIASSAEFYFKLAQQLARLFQTRYAAVAEPAPGKPGWIRTLGISADDQPAAHIEQALASTPCDEALANGIHYVPARAHEKYPEAPVLAGLKIESYLASSILDSRRNPLGLVILMHDQPWAPPPDYEPILKLFAESAGVRIERERSFAALRAAESRFRMAIEHSFDCLALHDASGICTYISPAVTRILGYTVEELAGQPASRIILPDDLPAYESHRALLGRTPDAHAELEIRVRHRDGTTRWIQTADTNRLEDASLRAIVCNFRDITERKHGELVQHKLEAQLRQSQKMEAIGTLAGGVAHDFNNILGAIIGCAELARLDSINNPPALANIDDLLKASHRARDLVKQILTFSRREEYQRKNISLEPLVAETSRLLRAALPQFIDLKTTVHAPLPVIHADPTLIQQVIMNLVTNASQAIGNRPGQVDVTVRERPGLGADAPPQVMIEIRDNGCGMEPAIVERIFEPFFTTKGPGQGTGLGLSVAHGIISAHGGAIRVESSPGKGSAFTILLPANRKTGDTARDQPRQPGLLRGTERILLVDDEGALLAVSEKILTRAGYRVTACTDATAALELFRRSPSDFDLVITDYSMPKHSGADLAREIFALRPRLPVIVCSGYTTSLTPDQSVAAGFCDYLHKPVAPDQFCLAVRRALDNATAEQRQP